MIALCNRCLHKDPTRRPSAREAAALLAGGAGMRVTGDELPPGDGAEADDEPSPATFVATQRPTPAAQGRTTDRAAAPALTPIVSAGTSTVPVGTATTGVPPTTPTHVDPSPTLTTTRPGPPPPAARGTVRAACPAPAIAHLLSWMPKKSYHVESVSPGPAAVTTVVFLRGKEGGVRMTITCRGGVPATRNQSV